MSSKMLQLSKDGERVYVGSGIDFYFFIGDDGRYYLHLPGGTFGGKEIDVMGKDAFAISSRPLNPKVPTDAPSIITWPTKLGDSIDKLIGHNERIALWYSSKEYTKGYSLLWKGMAWSTPGVYRDLHIIKVKGFIPESIDDADIINLIVDADDDTPKNLDPDYPNRDNCTDTCSCEEPQEQVDSTIPVIKDEDISHVIKINDDESFVFTKDSNVYLKTRDGKLYSGSSITTAATNALIQERGIDNILEEQKHSLKDYKNPYFAD